MHKIGNVNPNYNQFENKIVNVPLIIAAGGNGACGDVKGIDGLCDMAENRDNYGGYQSNGKAGRGGSFINDFNVFKSYKQDNETDYNKCNPSSFLDGAIGGLGFKASATDGGFGGGGGSAGENDGGGGGGYIGGVAMKQEALDAGGLNPSHQSYKCGALSYVCKGSIYSCDNIIAGYGIDMMISGYNDSDGRIEIMYLGE